MSGRQNESREKKKKWKSKRTLPYKVCLCKTKHTRVISMSCVLTAITECTLKLNQGQHEYIKLF